MDIRDYFKVSEMMVPTLSPRPPRGTLGAASTQPVFKDASGAVISSIECGQPYTFDVPGYNAIWLTMKKDGVQTFDGQFSVPMPSYIASCTTDPGTYTAIAYDLNTGMVLGTAVFVVRQPGTPAPAPGQPPVGPGTVSASLSPTMIMAGLVGLFLLTRRKSG